LRRSGDWNAKQEVRVGLVQVVSSIAELRSVLDRVRFGGGSVGFVPTMGYLHDGHASLIRRSVTDANTITAVTIFVNPLQFAANEDLAAYPRDLDRDLALCEASGAGIVLTPSVEEMYPSAILTTVSVAEVSGRMEGAARPSHFAGVATVVAKLFNIVGPCRSYFGEKDYQQLAVIETMAHDLNVPVEVVGCPIVRESDGLAMSSRNVYLSAEERVASRCLSAALTTIVDAIESGELSEPGAIGRALAASIEAEPLAVLDYAEVVDPRTLAPLVERLRVGDEARLIVAAQVGRPRLLDNMGATFGMARRTEIAADD